MSIQSVVQPFGSIPEITFAVDDVKPFQKQLAQRKMYETLELKLGGKLESCSDYHTDVAKIELVNPLVGAVYTAFSDHRPLTLSPDIIWVTIAQGISHHMTIHAESMRKKFVKHKGQLDLIFSCTGWVAGSPENPWHEAFESWSSQIGEHVGKEYYDALVCDFSTTGPIERSVSQVTMMDTFKRYFRYVLMCICGIPEVTLKGSTDDWLRLREKVNVLEKFEMTWWLQHLLPICDQLISASQGEVDLKHWKSICKLEDAYGGSIINGWIVKLFPYLCDQANAPATRRNPVFESGQGCTSGRIPSGLSKVPFKWIDVSNNQTRSMEAIGGLTGVIQNEKTGSLEPVCGWAVREASQIDQLFIRAKDVFELKPKQVVSVEAIEQSYRPDLPFDLGTFYIDCDGFDFGNDKLIRVVAESELEPLDIDQAISNGCSPNWFRIGDGENEMLVINLSPNYSIRSKYKSSLKRWELAPIAVLSKSEESDSMKSPVIALTFSEFLEQLMESNGACYWREGGFKPHGRVFEFCEFAGIKQHGADGRDW